MQILRGSRSSSVATSSLSCDFSARRVAEGSRRRPGATANDLLFRKLLPLHLSVPSWGSDSSCSWMNDGGHVTLNLARSTRLITSGQSACQAKLPLQSLGPPMHRARAVTLCQRSAASGNRRSLPRFEIRKGQAPRWQYAGTLRQAEARPDGTSLVQSRRRNADP